jgi:hypothetical protein
MIKANQGSPEPLNRAVLLRRDGKAPLKFNGVKLGGAFRSYPEANDNGDTFETTAKLFRTAGGKFVIGVEEYNRTTEQYVHRYAEKADSLGELVAALKLFDRDFDPDLLAELFGNTEIADSLVETVE